MNCASTLPSTLPGKLGLAILLVVALLLAGCSSTSSSTSGYSGAPVSSAAEKKKSATRAVTAAKRQLSNSKRKFDKLQRLTARDERRLKRKKLSKRSRDKIKANVAKREPAIKSARRELKKAQQAYDRALRAERRASRAYETARRRKQAAERRFAEAEKRKAKRLDENRVESQAGTSTFAGSLFGFGRSGSGSVNVNEYRARSDGGFRVAAIPVNKMDKRLLRQQVRYRTRHKVGTLVVDPRAKYLYLVQPGGMAMRYGIGVGKAGFEWSGSAHIGWKQKWPKWTPPDEMVARRPDLAKWSVKNGGMPGGPSNPLGARALYLMQGGKDTLYRLHGTPEWNSIGTAASSGCIRLMNQDVIDLYNRVPNGAKVVVLS